jgi:hypothetical protein
MLIQVRTDNHIQNSEALAGRIRAEIEGAVQHRFGNQLQRVEVYVQDLNGHKGGIDKRCSIEAHLAGLQPIAVHENAGTVDRVVSGAVDKMLRALERKLDRLADRGGRVPRSGEGT